MAGSINLIRSDGERAGLISRYGGDTFSAGTQLLVHESEEALFFKNGQALDLFGPGRHTLTTQNLPLLSRLFGKGSGGKDIFQSEVYFIKKTEQMGILWGTDSRVMYLDPNFNNYPFSVGASGEMSLRVADSRKLLIKLVGNASGLDKRTLSDYIKPIIMMKIKSYLPSVLRAKGVPVYDTIQFLEEFSAELKNMLNAELETYGVELPGFWMTRIRLPEEDPAYIEMVKLKGRAVTEVGNAEIAQKVRVIDAQTKAQEIIIESEAMAKKRAQEGYTKQWEDSAETAKLAAQNAGAGDLTSAGIGLGVMSGMSGGIGMTVAGMAKDVMSADAPPAAQMAMQAAPADPLAEFKVKVEKLKLMRENGIIDDAEFAKEKQRLLESI